MSVVSVLWVILSLALGCVVYLFIDWIVDEIKQRKREREELEPFEKMDE